jgi:hypothetical protein
MVNELSEKIDKLVQDRYRLEESMQKVQQEKTRIEGYIANLTAEIYKNQGALDFAGVTNIPAYYTEMQQRINQK